MKKALYILILAITFSACEKIVDVDLESEAPRLVVEGQITNLNEPWAVKLSLSQPYFDQTEARDISNAIVRITGTDGQDVQLAYTDTGMFVSTSSQMCTVGENYTLSIDYDGQKFEATEVLKEGFPIDTITSYFLPDGNGFIPSGYYVFIQGTERPEEGDYYMFKAYRWDSTSTEDTLKTTQLEDDEFGPVSYLNSNFDVNNILGEIANGKTPRPFPFLVLPNDSIRVEQFAITEQYYDYVIDLDNQQGRSGSPFDPPPANPNNNLSNGALGYFSVAHKETAEYVVRE